MMKIAGEANKTITEMEETIALIIGQQTL